MSTAGTVEAPITRAPLRIVIADDHDVVLAGLRALIEAEPDFEVAGQAKDAAALWALTRDLLPDLVVLDLSMASGTDVHAAERIQRDFPSVGIVALTMHEERGDLLRLMRAGASGYVLKRTASGELVRAIRAVSVGDVYVDPSLAGMLLLGSRDEAGRGALVPSALARDLSPRELETIQRVARGYGNKDVAALLGISVKTVETHKANAMRKLDLTNRVALVRLAIDEGWLA